MIMDIKRVPVSIYAEMTPNPKVMKFVSNKLLLQTDSAEFRNIEEAKPSPLATKLFHFPFVKEVFISGNYIAIAKFDVIEWDDVAQEVRIFITEFLQEGGVAVNEDLLVPKQEEIQESNGPVLSGEDKSEVEQRIVDILEEYIKLSSTRRWKHRLYRLQRQGSRGSASRRMLWMPILNNDFKKRNLKYFAKDAPNTSRRRSCYKRVAARLS